MVASSGPVWLRYRLALGGALLFALLCPPPLEAARVRLGPLEIDTNDAQPRPELPAPPITEPEQPAGEVVEATALFFEPSRSQPHPFVLPADARRLVYHAQLSEEVELGLSSFLERVLGEAVAARADVLIIEIDTPGGRVDAAVKIKDLLLAAKLPTVAFINRQAISAGALIALAHDHIYWSSGATMGAATPVQMGGGGEQPEATEEKITSYMRGVMRATAQAKGRDGLVAEAMVDADIELAGYAPKGKLLTADFTQAEALGLQDGTAESLEELLETLGLAGATVVTPEINWAERAARLLTGPVISSVLMTLGMLGLVIELYTPGFGLAGIVGLVALFLFFAGHLAVHLAGLEELLLFALGGALLAAEIFLIPGFGIAGVAGLLAVGASLMLALVGLEFQVAFEVGTLFDAFARVSLSVVAALALAMLAIRLLPTVRPLNRLVLSHSLTREVGAVSGAVGGPAPGTRGIALTDLRPGGRVLFGADKVDVVALDQYVRKGEAVQVLRVDGSAVTVERCPPPPDGEIEHG